MSLTEAFVEESNIEQAWKNVKANRGALALTASPSRNSQPGFRPRWNAIRQQLLDGTYQPQPVRRVRFRPKRSAHGVASKYDAPSDAVTVMP